MKNTIIRAAGVLLAASMIFGGAAATASAAEATSPSTGTTSSTQAAESINREWVLNPANNTELAALGTIQGGSQTFDGLTIDATANGAKFAPRANDTQINAGTIISIPVPAHTNTATITLALSGGTTTITADAGEVSSDNTVIALPAAESARTVNVTFTAQTYLNGIALAEQQPEPEFPGTPTVAAKDTNWDFTETGIDRPAVQGLPTTTKGARRQVQPAYYRGKRRQRYSGERWNHPVHSGRTGRGRRYSHREGPAVRSYAQARRYGHHHRHCCNHRNRQHALRAALR